MKLLLIVNSPFVTAAVSVTVSLPEEGRFTVVILLFLMTTAFELLLHEIDEPFAPVVGSVRSFAVLITVVDSFIAFASSFAF